MVPIFLSKIRSYLEAPPCLSLLILYVMWHCLENLFHKKFVYFYCCSGCTVWYLLMFLQFKKYIIVEFLWNTCHPCFHRWHLKVTIPLPDATINTALAMPYSSNRVTCYMPSCDQKLSDKWAAHIRINAEVLPYVVPSYPEILM